MKTGLVFSGGGGKGAYQIGVWQAMNKFKIQAQCVAGTSVGALNGALYTQGNFEKARDIWINIKPEDMLHLDIDSIVKKFSKSRVHVKLDDLSLIVRGKGIFGQEKLERIIRKNIDLVKISSNDSLEFYVCSHKKNDKLKYFHIKDYDEDNVVKILLSSSAIPIIWGDIEIEGAIYEDGGGSIHGALSDGAIEDPSAYDNDPITPVYDAGCEVIIWVALDSLKAVDRSKYPNARVLPIFPRSSVGGLFSGTLDFSSEGAKKRIQQGYDDAVRIFNVLSQVIKSDTEYEKIWKNAMQEEKKLHISLNEINNAVDERQELKNTIIDLNRLVMHDNFTKDIPIPDVDLDDLELIYSRGDELISNIDQEEIEINITDYIEKNRDNSTELNNAVMEAVTFLSPVEGAANAVARQGFLGRIFHSISGKNQKINASNQAELARSQFAALKYIQRVNEKNLLTLDFACAMNSKINRLFGDIARLDNEINTQYKNIYKTLTISFLRCRKEIMKNSRKIENMESRLNLVEWKQQASVLSWNGREYSDMAPAELLICLVNDFYNLTDGNWNVREMLTFKAVLRDNFNLADTEISYLDIANALQGKMAKKKLLNNLTSEISFDKSYLAEFTITKNKEKSLINTGEFSCHTGYMLATDMLHALKQCKYHPVKKQSLAGLKSEMARKIERLEEIAKKHGRNSWEKELENLKHEIIEYRLIVPIIGDFSSGKSTLLNKYMECDILPSDLAPETAIAAELHFTNKISEQRIIVNYLDGKRNESPEVVKSEFEHINKNAADILYVEIYINNNALSEHQDICLVDMPGLDSPQDAHNKAILNYIKMGSTFILCVASDSVLTESVHDFIQETGMYRAKIYGVLTKTDKRHDVEKSGLKSHLADALAEIGYDQPVVKGISAINDDLQGWEELLQLIESEKEKILGSVFVPQVDMIAGKMEKVLTSMMQKNDSLDSLKEKRNALKTQTEKLRGILRKEKVAVMDESNSITESVASDVLSALNQMRESFKAEMKSGIDCGNRITSAAQNAFKLALIERSNTTFQKSAEKIDRYIPNIVYANTDDIACSPGNITNVKDFFDSKIALLTVGGVTMTALGLPAIVLFGPVIVGLFGGLLGGREIKKSIQVEKALNNAFEQVISSVRANVPNAYRIMADSFIEKLDKKVNELILEADENINKLEKELTISENNYNERRKSIAADIDIIKSVRCKVPEISID